MSRSKPKQGKRPQPQPVSQALWEVHGYVENAIFRLTDLYFQALTEQNEARRDELNALIVRLAKLSKQVFVLSQEAQTREKESNPDAAQQ